MAIERGKTYTPDELLAELNADMAAHGFMSPIVIVEAAEALRAEFETTLAPARVVFDYNWPQGGLPQLQLGFEHDGKTHGLRAPQKAGENPAATLLEFCRDNRVELLARVGIEP